MSGNLSDIFFLVVILATSAESHRVTESIEDVPPEAFFNTTTTTLYPVAKNTTNQISNNPQNNDKRNSDNSIWTSESPITEEEHEKSEKKETEKLKKNATVVSDDFKPSPQLGSYLDETGTVDPTQPTLRDFRPVKKPSTSLLSASKDRFKSALKGFPKSQTDISYNLDGIITTRAKDSWRPMTVDSRPSVTSGTVPAGDLYKSPDAFKGQEQPLAPYAYDFGFDHNDQKDNQNHLSSRKPVNPWKNLLRLMTAFIPVGLIISALTPNVLTVQSSDADNNRYGNLYRRWEPGENVRPADIASISEPCRRRLLCELQSDKNFTTKLKYVKSRSCHRIRCEDLDAVYGTLYWLLSRHRIASGARHGDRESHGNHRVYHDDSRARHGNNE